MRRRYLYRPDGNGGVEVTEVASDYQSTRGLSAPVSDLYMDGVRAPDGTDIGSRAKRRAYMQAHGLADADDFKGTWEKAARRREEVLSGRADKKERREQIARAMEKRR